MMASGDLVLRGKYVLLRRRSPSAGSVPGRGVPEQVSLRGVGEQVEAYRQAADRQKIAEGMLEL
jgi:hypothetical protein